MSVSKITYLITTLFVFALTGCRYYEYDVINETSIQNPREVRVYLDCSLSMQGFFNENSEAIGLLGNLNKEFSIGDIDISYHQFNSKVDSLTNDYETFSSVALNRGFYQCQNNLYSQPFRHIVPKYGIEDNILHLILTDGVTSVSKAESSLPREYSDILNSLTPLAKDDQSNISLYQFRYNFKGSYWAQPADTEVKADNDTTKRNLYLIAIGDLRFSSFLDKLMLHKNNAVRGQHFNRSLNNKLTLQPLCNAKYVADNRLELSFISNDQPSYLLDQKSLLENLNISDNSGNKLEYTFTGSTTLSINIGQPKESIINIQTVNDNTKTHSIWNSLYYDSPELPEDNRVDHNKTYRLGTLINSFENIYEDRPCLDKRLKVNKSSSLSYWGAVYVPVLGNQPQSFWLENRVYAWLVLMCLIMPAITVSFFYLSTVFNDTVNPMKWWMSLLLVQAVIGLIATIAIIYSQHTNCQNGLALGFGVVLSHGFLNFIYGIIVFSTLSILLKNFNPNLSNIPL
ncbi:MAG: hypothetical protein AAFX87_18710 [Bacteroidota bacterium]